MTRRWTYEEIQTFLVWQPYRYAAFVEAEHPRDDDGKFVTKFGYGSSHGLDPLAAYLYQHLTDQPMSLNEIQEKAGIGGSSWNTLRSISENLERLEGRGLLIRDEKTDKVRLNPKKSVNFEGKKVPFPHSPTIEPVETKNKGASYNPAVDKPPSGWNPNSKFAQAIKKFKEDQGKSNGDDAGKKLEQAAKEMNDQIANDRRDAMFAAHDLAREGMKKRVEKFGVSSSDNGKSVLVSFEKAPRPDVLDSLKKKGFRYFPGEGWAAPLSNQEAVAWAKAFAGYKGK